MAAAELAETMLEKALETTRATRDIQNEHASEAATKLKQAENEEDDAEISLKAAHERVETSEGQTAMIETLDGDYEDEERLRDLSVMHAAHQEEIDLEAIVNSAHAMATQAREELEEANDSLELLAKYETELKATLKEMRLAKQKLAMKEWEKDKA